jgi:hypothetical protein
MMRTVVLAAVASIGVVGCGMNPGQVADRVPIKGQVTFADGKPVRDVMLTLQPLERGHMAGLKVGADGAFNGDAVPGKYAYYFAAQEGKTAAEKQKFGTALRAVPEQYRTLSMERTVAVNSGGGDLQIKLN